MVFKRFLALIAFFYLFLFSAQSSHAGEEAALVTFLNIDRFQAYIEKWQMHMSSQGKENLVVALGEITPETISKMNLNSTQLSDAFNYDKLILKILKEKSPTLKVSLGDVSWPYDFYKRKLNEAYVIAPVTPRNKGVVYQGIISDVDSDYPLPQKNLNPDNVLLDVDHYVSDRSTRGVFWEASKSGREIELHIGPVSNFHASLKARGMKVIGTIKTRARNYNPIYLVQSPGEKDFHYAISEIGGADRLKHYSMQINLIRWKNGEKLASIPPVSVFGDALLNLRQEAVVLEKVLSTLPLADKVIIGQKGAFERTFLSLSKAESLIEFQKSNPKVVASLLDEEELAFLLKAQNDPDLLLRHCMKNAAKWDKLYENLFPYFSKYKISPASQFTVFNLDRGTYQISDYFLKSKNKKIQRWRIVSNSWGDEILPVAKALRATGHKDIIYIGTAGSLGGNNLQVGDVVIPSSTIDSNGIKYKLATDIGPHGAKEIETVVSVSSPFEETEEWLKSNKGKAQAVEIETAHLASVFNKTGDRLQAFLLVSDIVGAEGQDLAMASSSDRRAALIDTIEAIFDDGKVSFPAAVESVTKFALTKWIDEIAPSRDLASKYHIKKLAEGRGISTKLELQKLLEEELGFTTKVLVKRLQIADDKLTLVFDRLSDAGLKPKMSLSGEFIEGRWSPRQGPIAILLSASNKEIEAEIKSILDKIKKSDKDFVKFLTVQVARGPPPPEYISLGVFNLDELSLLETYQDSALAYGGLAFTETRTGELKFVQVGDGLVTKRKEGLSFFPPNQSTEELLKELSEAGNSKNILIKEIKFMNKAAGANRPWEISLTVVDELADGRLAQIIPVIDGKSKNLTILLQITKDGLKNPAVVLEELIHLQQITGTPVPWKNKTVLKSFIHPFHWAEIVANANAGDLEALEKLARLELEASLTSEDAVRYYQKEGLFASSDQSKIIDDYLEARKKHAEELYKKIVLEARAEMKVRNESWERAKKVFSKLEENQNKFNDLVAKGDRKGVRKLIETYLPWDKMAPSEKNVWKIWLEAIENPDPKRSQIVFRGMYDDTILRTQKGEPFLMSTVMTRNQGNYTRRLRSLDTMRDKFGREAIRDASSRYNLPRGKNPPSVSVMMANHATEPLGSPFLSVANYDVATKFGPRQLGAFNIDERRLILNALAPDKYLWEQEKLVPLVIFPDEVVHFHDYRKDPVEGIGRNSPALRKKHYLAEVEKKLGRPLKSHEISGKGTDAEFLQESYRRLKLEVLDSSRLPKTSNCPRNINIINRINQAARELLDVK